MFNINIKKAAEICGGKLNTDKGTDCEIKRCVIDSRTIQSGDMFVAYKGERVDGHAFISSSIDKGAVCALAEYVPEGETRPVIVVDNVQEAFEKLAAYIRSQLNIPVIGITGSVGKTTAKEMISAVLTNSMKICKTDGNLNNQIGVPITLSKIENDDKAAVIEMGINHFGEMTCLAKIVRPTIAVYTVIGHAHLEFLNDLDGVLKAKTEMLDYMTEDGIIILNGDDEKLATVKNSRKIISYGLGENCTLRATDIDTVSASETYFTANYEGKSFRVTVSSYGKQMIYAALEGIAVGLAIGLPEDSICEGIKNYKPAGRRAAVIETENITIIDDCYNANPDSVKCSIDSLTAMNGRHVCVLGDMLELGDGTEKMHFEVGRYAKEKGMDLVIACGNLAKNIADGFGEGSVYIENTPLLLESIAGYIKPGDFVLVKASNAMKFGSVTDTLKQI